MKKTILKELLLLFGTLIWGGAFIFQKTGMDYLSPITFNTIRLFIGAFAVGIVALTTMLYKKKKGTYKERSKKDLFFGGLLAGIAVAIAMCCQQIGISKTSAGKSGFLTALYIIFVPLLGLFFHKKINKFIVIGVILAITGLYLVNFDEGKLVFDEGTIWLIACAIVYAIQILIIDKFSSKCDSLQLSFVQFFIAGIVSLPLMFIFEKPHMEDILKAYIPLLYVGILSTGVAFTIQTYTQKYIHPTIASMIMSFESVFSIILAFIFLKETYGVFEIVGCLLIFFAIIISQIPSKKDMKKFSQTESNS